MFYCRLSKQQEAHQSLFESSGCGDGGEIVAFAQCLALRSVVRVSLVYIYIYIYIYTKQLRATACVFTPSISYTMKLDS